QTKLCAVGQADFATDQPFGVQGNERRARGGADVVGASDVNRDHQQNIVAVAVVHDLRRTLQPVRSRPLDLACRQAGGKLPLEDRRLAGITRIDPVNVPSRLQQEMDAQQKVLPGLDGGALRDQVDSCVFDRKRLGGHGATRSRDDYEESNKKREQPRGWHISIVSKLGLYRGRSLRGCVRSEDRHREGFARGNLSSSSL